MRSRNGLKTGVSATCWPTAVAAATLLTGLSWSTSMAQNTIRGSLSDAATLPYTESSQATFYNSGQLRSSLPEFTRPSSSPLSAVVLRQSILNQPIPAAGGQGLRSSIDAVLRRSTALRASLHDSNAAKLREKVARASLLPTLNVSTSYSEARTQSSFASQERDGSEITTSVEVSMPLFSSGRLYYGAKSVRHAALARDYDYLALEQQTAYEAVIAWLEIYLASRRHQAVARNAAALEDILNGVRKQFTAGFASKGDVATAAAELAQMRESLVQEEARFVTAQSDFRARTGQPAPQISGVPSVEELIPGSLDAAIEEGLRHSARILSAQSTSMADHYSAKAVRGRYLPQVNLFGGYDHTRELDSGREDEEDWRVGVRLSVPLVDFTGIPSVQEAREKALSSEYRARDVHRATEQSIRSSWIGYHSGKKRAALAGETIRQLRAAAKGTRKEYEAGFKPLSDVLRAQIRLTQARIDLAEIETAYVSAAFLLKITSSTFDLASLPD